MEKTFHTQRKPQKHTEKVLFLLDATLGFMFSYSWLAGWLAGLLACFVIR